MFHFPWWGSRKPFTGELRLALPALILTLHEVSQAMTGKHSSIPFTVTQPDVVTALKSLGFIVGTAAAGQLSWGRRLSDFGNEANMQGWLKGLTNALEAVQVSRSAMPELSPIADVRDDVLNALESLGFRVEISHNRVVWPNTA